MIFGPKQPGPRTEDESLLRELRGKRGRDSRCDSRDGIINPSNCHLEVTARQARFSPGLPPPLSHVPDRALLNLSSLKLKLVLFPGIYRRLFFFLLLVRFFLSLEPRASGRIDDNCQGPKINHVFFSITDSGREGRRQAVPEKDRRDGRLVATR